MSYLEVVISTKARISMKMWMQVGRTYIPTTKDFRFFFADTVSGEITVRDQLVFVCLFVFCFVFFLGGGKVTAPDLDWRHL